MAKNDLEVRRSKLLIMYSEALKQYIHEDTLSHTKNTFFLSSHGAMLAVLTGVSSVLIKLEPVTYNSISIFYGIILLGFIAILIGILGLTINKYWNSINEAHRAYSHARWLSAIAIETELELTDVGLAGIEHRWKENQKKTDNEFYPFKDVLGLEEHKIKDRHSFEGYDSIGGVIKIINILWLAIIFVALLSVTVNIFFSLSK